MTPACLHSTQLRRESQQLGVPWTEDSGLCLASLPSFLYSPRTLSSLLSTDQPWTCCVPWGEPFVFGICCALNRGSSPGWVALGNSVLLFSASPEVQMGCTRGPQRALRLQDGVLRKGGGGKGCDGGSVC